MKNNNSIQSNKYLLLFHKFRNYLFFALFLGLSFDFSIFIESSPVFVFYGFFLILPVTVYLLIVFFDISHIKDKTAIIFFTTVFFIFVIEALLFIEIEVMDSGGDMDVFSYFLFVPPTIIVGLIFGYFLAQKINILTK